MFKNQQQIHNFEAAICRTTLGIVTRSSGCFSDFIISIICRFVVVYPKTDGWFVLFDKLRQISKLNWSRVMFRPKLGGDFRNTVSCC